MKFPKGFPSDGVTDYKGKELITRAGLIWLASDRGPWSCSVDHVERVFDDTGLPMYVEVHVTVTDQSGDIETKHTAIGDAAINNVNGPIAAALPRMAHTRALSRALCSMLGIGRTTAEEMGPDSPERIVKRSTPQPAANHERAARVVSEGMFGKGDTVRTSKGNVGKLFWIGGEKGDRVGVSWGEGDDDKEWTYLRFLSAPETTSNGASSSVDPNIEDRGDSFGNDADIPF